MEDTWKSTKSRANPASFVSLAPVRDKSLISTWNKNGLIRTSPTSGLTPTNVFGISSSRALRKSLGAAQNPAAAYTPISSAAMHRIRKVFVLKNCRMGPSRPGTAAGILPLIALDQPFPLAYLPGCQGIALAGERVLLAPEGHPDRSTHQIEGFAIDIDQVAPVGIRHMIGLVAVDDHDGRIAATLMRVAEFDAAPADQRGLVAFDGRLQHARQLRRTHVAHGRRIDLAYRRKQLADAAAMARGDEMQGCEIGELQPLLDLLANQIPLFRGNVVPFVDGQHQGASLLDHRSQEARVLLRDRVVRVHHHNDHVRGFDGLQGLDDTELFDRFLDA